MYVCIVWRCTVNHCRDPYWRRLGGGGYACRANPWRSLSHVRCRGGGTSTFPSWNHPYQNLFAPLLTPTFVFFLFLFNVVFLRIANQQCAGHPCLTIGPEVRRRPMCLSWRLSRSEGAERTVQDKDEHMFEAEQIAVRHLDLDPPAYESPLELHGASIIASILYPAPDIGSSCRQGRIPPHANEPNCPRALVLTAALCFSNPGGTPRWLSSRWARLPASRSPSYPLHQPR